MSDAAFPFLYHGPSPDDWFDEPVHAWIVRFASEPTPAQRTSLASAWERATRDFARGLGADFRLPWWWSGAWALVPARVGDRSPATMRALFEAAQSMLRAAHTAAPIAEVSYAQAADVSSRNAWEAWTVARAPLPTEPPVWPAEAVTHAKKTRKRTKAAVDEAFEAARAHARGPEVVPSVRSVVDEEDEPDETPDDEGGDDEGGGDEGGDEESGDDAPAEVELPTPRGCVLRLEPCDAEALDARAQAERPQTGAGELAMQLRDGTWCMRAKPSKRDKDPRLAVVIDGALTATAHSGGLIYTMRAWSPATRELLIDTTHTTHGLSVASLDDATSRVVWTDLMLDGVNAAFWLAGGDLFVGSARGVGAWRATPAGYVAGSFHAWSLYDGDPCARAPDGRGVVLALQNAACVVSVVVPVDGALRIAGEAALETEGYATLRIHSDGVYLVEDDRAWRVEGIAAAIDALLAAPGDTERFPALPTAPSPEERADPARNSDADECFNVGARAKDEGDDAKAETWLRRAVELMADNAMAWHGLGHVLQRTGRDAEGRTCLERALAGYDANLVAQGDEPDDEVRFWRAATLSRLRRRDEALAALRAMIVAGHYGNWTRDRARGEEDFEWLRADPEFMALTERVARAKKAAKKTAKRAAAEPDDDPED